MWCGIRLKCLPTRKLPCPEVGIKSSYWMKPTGEVRVLCAGAVMVLGETFSMTDGAQQALRRTMEIYAKTTRFALACNASDKIIGSKKMQQL